MAWAQWGSLGWLIDFWAFSVPDEVKTLTKARIHDSLTLTVQIEVVARVINSVLLQARYQSLIP